MIQTLIAYGVVAAAAAWSLRGFLPRFRPIPVEAETKSKGGCENCGH